MVNDLRPPASGPYKRGWQAALEDVAIGASFGVPDETLPAEYRQGYVDGWREALREDEQQGLEV